MNLKNISYEWHCSESNGEMNLINISYEWHCSESNGFKGPIHTHELLGSVFFFLRIKSGFTSSEYCSIKPEIPKQLIPRWNVQILASHRIITSSKMSCYNKMFLLDFVTTSKALHLELFRIVVVNGLSSIALIYSSVEASSSYVKKNCKGTFLHG